VFCANALNEQIKSKKQILFWKIDFFICKVL
jgi:hypothetical protein